MFNSTHTLIGLAIAKTGPEKWAPYAAATAVIAANLPDIDSVALLWGPAAYLDHHRGLTHSVFGAPALALLLSAVMYIFSKEFWKTFAVALIAIATHPVLDYLNPYGLRPWLPWNGSWYYGDIEFIFDPYLDLILLTGIVLRRFVTLKRSVIWITLGVAAAYVGVRVQLHAAAAARLQEEAAQVSVVEKSAAIPQINPVVWEGVILTPHRATKFPIDLLGRPARRPETMVARSPDSDVVVRASTAPSAAALLRFARFPASRVEQTASGYRVSFIDLRFYNAENRNTLGSEVFLNPSLEVTQDRMALIRY